MVNRICLHCGKEFNVFPYKIKLNKGIYCSKKCYYNHKRISVNCLKCGRKFNVAQSRYNDGRGKFCSKICASAYISKQKKVICGYCGRTYTAKASELKRRKNHYCSVKCFKKDYKNKYGGDKSPNWKGGKQRERHNGNYKYSNWRLKVYERDNFTCQICGQRGVKLNAHHQFSWAEYPSFRYELWNGVTLCEKCHKQEHGKKEILNGCHKGKL